MSDSQIGDAFARRPDFWQAHPDPDAANQLPRDGIELRLFL
jgi:hypothetical protein